MDSIQAADMARRAAPAIEEVKEAVTFVFANAKIPEGLDRATIVMPAIFDQWYVLLRTMRPDATHDDCAKLAMQSLTIAGARYEQAMQAAAHASGIVTPR